MAADAENRGWFKTATEWHVVRRALWCMLIVGAILTSINHGAALLSGDVSRQRLCQIALTLVVPYCVSTYSSVSAVRNRDRRSTEPDAGS